MFTLKDYLSESVLLVEAKVSLAHAEDLILSSGYEGAKRTLNYLEGVAGMLAGDGNAKVNVTTKWDGAPAIFAGKHPENGKFFVGTKSIFNKTNPRMLYTPDDVDAHYGEKAELNKTLKAALKYMPKLGIDGIVQGDIMFLDDTVKEQTVDGEKYITFHPNTILYAVPAESDLAKKIKRAKIGIIFHTSYHGDSISNMKPSYNVDVDSFKKSPDIWFDDATYKDASGTATMTADETADVAHHISAARTALTHITKKDLELLFSNKTFVGLIQQFINHRIRGGVQLGNMERIPDELLQFLEMKVQKEKTQPKTKEKKIQRLHAHAGEIKQALMKVLQFQQHVVETKELLIQKLEAAKSIGTFHVTDKGMEVAPQEGFVAVDHLGSNAIKLVNRLSFSRANFLRHAKRSAAEDEEALTTSDRNTGPIGGTPSGPGPALLSKSSIYGGETGLAGNETDPTVGDKAPLGNPTGQFWGSTGTL